MMLTKENVRSLAPAAFATEPDKFRSDKYTFVSSERVIDEMSALNWGVYEATTIRTRVSDRNHSKHLIKFRSNNPDAFVIDPRGVGYDGFEKKMFPELLWYNSSDGSFRCQFYAGLFTMVCSNGLVITLTDFGSFGHKHQGFDAEVAYSITADFTNRMDEVMGMVETMTNTDTSDFRYDYARRAKELRWDSGSNVNPTELLNPRRAFDDGTDLWTTYNVIQENLIKGGNFGGKRKSRGLNNIVKEHSINTGLWDLTKEYCVN